MTSDTKTKIAKAGAVRTFDEHRPTRPPWPRNVKCWIGDKGTTDFSPHLRLEDHPGETFIVGGYSFDREDVAAGVERLQAACAGLQERVWELEDAEENDDA